MNEVVDRIVKKIMQRLDRANKPIICNVSNRHFHLTSQHFEKLFGPAKTPTNIRNLVQPGQFACKEVLTIVSHKGKIENVRMIGPLRNYSQVEISRTDSYILGINPPIRESGDLKGAETLLLIGPYGQLELKEVCIIALRHIHFHPKDAEEFQVKDKDIVRIKAGNQDRELIFGNVICRVREDMALECHIDTDEANAAGVKNGDFVYIV